MLRSKLAPKLVLAAAILALLLYPFQTMVVPEWRVRVSDEVGNVVRGVLVREVWSNYAIESHDHAADLMTDESGYVTFSRQTVRANVLVRVIKTMMSKLNPHGGSGPAAYLLVLGEYKALTDEPYYLPGRPLANEIVVRREGKPVP